MDKIFNEILNEKQVELTKDQEKKFRHACEKAVSDNSTYQEQKLAAQLYLNYILEFPELSL